MSGILGAYTAGGPPLEESVARGMLNALQVRGGESAAVRCVEDALLAVTRHDWELGPGFSGPALISSDGDVTVVADASLYYKSDLRRRLASARIQPAGDSPGALILAAYQAWGERCVEFLEGDFAFILHDSAVRRLFCARSFSGKRPLYYVEVGGALIVASTIGALLAHPACPADLNLVCVAECAAGMYRATNETSYAAIRSVPVACTLVRTGRSTVRLARYAEPPRFEEGDGPPFDKAGEELREILRAAVAERLDTDGPTSVWLSGGWDSTAVFASGKSELERHGREELLRAVSISYPVGDPGREDELIMDVARHWNADVRWLDIAQIPLFQNPVRDAAEREEPLAHGFEFWNRALAEGSRAEGARVALDGVGGDPIFQVSIIYLADLVRSGRWMSAAQEWRARGMSGSGFRSFFRWMIQPLLPPVALDLAAVLRGGRPLAGYLDWRVPPWIRQDFVRRHQLLERNRARVTRYRGASHAGFEAYWFLTEPFFPEMFRMVSGFALEAGVELRSPLYDERVIAFASTRPRAERAEGRETKRLLRAAMRGLLPEGVLAPRLSRTGTTGAYFMRSMRVSLPPLLENASSPLALERAGIVDADALRVGAKQALQGDQLVALNLFLTLQTELWLQGRVRAEDAVGGSPSVVMANAVAG